MPAGAYKIVVHDYSTIHNFHLTGAGVDSTTSVEEITTVTWNVTFARGTYKYVCDPHAPIMKGSFKVT